MTRVLVRALSSTLPHLAIFAVMLLSFASGGTLSWQCQGRDCGANPWTCCCAQPDDLKAAECTESRSHFQRDLHAAEVGACPLSCHCSKGLQDQKPSVSSASYSFTAPVLFTVPKQFELAVETPVFTELVQVPASRGPPPQAPCLALPRLRGPPSPDVFSDL